jgi:osmotically-inducible protein OsmY
MHRTLQLLALAALISLSSACVIVVDDGEGSVDATWASSYSTTEADEELARQVGDSIDDDPVLRTEDLRVSVRRGVVTLNGEVSDIPTLERAVDVANSVEGVRRVVSRLAVEVSSSRS